jgi:hypothetical protein
MRHHPFLVLLFITVPAFTPARSQTGTWTSPVPLSTGGQGWEAAAAIDFAGDSLAVWDERTTQDQLRSLARAAGDHWGHAAEVSAALQSTLVFPALRIAAGGFASAVWSDSDGVWTADRPASGTWNPPQLLLPGATAPIFTMNSRGDAVIVWTVGGPPGNQSSVMATLRPAGQSWSSPEILSSGAYVTADHLGISEDGEVIATWESFAATCNAEGCAEFNFGLHTSRNNGVGWTHTGVLLGPDPDSHIARVALDAAGHAILVALNNAGVYVSATLGTTGAWSPFATAVFVNGLSIECDVASDSAGNVTMVYEAIGFSTSRAYAIEGSISDNTWSAPVLLSGSDTVSQIYFSVSPNGSAIAAWLSSGGVAAIRASIRAGSGAAWGTPVTVSAPSSTEIGPEAAAISNSGSAIVIYSGYDASQVHTEYAVNYTP